MLIRVGYEIALKLAQSTPMFTLMSVHPERAKDVIRSSGPTFRPDVERSTYIDMFGNECTKLVAPEGVLTMRYDAVVADSGLADSIDPHARQVEPSDLPGECLVYLLGSRYCETDILSPLAWDLFGKTEPGWARVKAICDYVHKRLTFSYGYARATRTAAEAHRERVGVCRDFAHLAITLCRCMNIPARYVNGYLGDIGVEPDPSPMDFNAWFEVYLGGRWHTFDARHNQRRIGRIVVARGRDATDVPILHSFGPHSLQHFEVWTDEIVENQAPRQPASRIRRRESCLNYGPPGRSPHDLGSGEHVTRLL